MFCRITQRKGVENEVFNAFSLCLFSSVLTIKIITVYPYIYERVNRYNIDNWYMLEELERAHEEGVYLAGLNENLLRIARERANADRKLKPKKEHTGYVVVSSTEKEYRYKINRRDFETATLWETVLQSPYSIDFTEEQARRQMRELIGNDGKDIWLVSRLGISASYDGEYEEMLEKATWSD